MKKVLAVITCILLISVLAGCGRENPYRVDTVIRIPVDPTDAPTEQTEPVTEATEESTEEVMPEMTEEATEETKTSGSSGGKKPTSSGNKKPSGSGSKETEPAQTESPETKPPVTEPEETETEPPEPEVTVTQPTEPEATEPEATEPESTEPEETEAVWDPSSYQVGSLEHAILAEINAYRAEAGLPALSLSVRLSGIASVRAEEASRVWSHSRPDGRYYTSAMSDYGYGCSVSAENLIYASGSGDAASMVAKWMSADNKDSLLSESFTTAGIGAYRFGVVTYVANLLVG